MQSSSENNFWVVDTEDDSKGKVYWIDFYNGRDHVTFTNPKLAIDFIKTIKGRIWACNARYDVGNIFRDDLEKIELNFRGSRLIYGRFHSAYIFDTLNHWKLSVQAMGERLGFEKLPFDPKNLEYCRRDTEVTYKFVRTMLDRYNIIGMEAKSTLPASSFRFWHNSCNFSLLDIPEKQLDAIYPAYYGGRTECFFIGKNKGDIYYIDINSMYPACMLGKLPDPYSASKTKFTLDADGISSCSVYSDMDLPVLPYRMKSGRLAFPNGNFSGLWTNNELRYFIERGGRIKKKNHTWVYSRECDPFTSFISDLYARRKKEKDRFLKDVYKDVMNSLYGKFGQGKERSFFMSLEKFKASKYRPETWDIFQDKIVIFTIIGDYPKQTNYIWPAYITARARIKLHTLMMDIQSLGNQVLYCDTDSVIFKGSMVGLTPSDGLGSYKLERHDKEFVVKTAKIYKLTGLDDQEFIKCKGVKKQNQKEFFETGETMIHRPISIKEGLRRNLIPNVWVEQRKMFVETYSKGKVDKSGNVLPLIIK